MINGHLDILRLLEQSGSHAGGVATRIFEQLRFSPLRLTIYSQLDKYQTEWTKFEEQCSEV